MLVRFDPESRAWSMGIREFLEFGLLPEHLAVPGYVDLQERGRIHLAHQREVAEGDAAVRREVSLELRGEWRGYRYRLRGRADLLREDETGVEVTELKTVAGMPEDADPVALHTAYALQLAFYVWALEQAGETRPIRAVLVYLVLGEQTRPVVRRFELSSRIAELRSLFEAQLERVVRYIERESAWRREQRRSLEAYVFPHAERRDGQWEMEQAVERAVAEGEHLFIQAPTGIGKTAAVLAAAGRLAVERDLTLFYLTAKGTQARAVWQAVSRFAESGLRLRVIELQAREKICPRPSELCCEPAICPLAEAYGSRIAEAGLLERLLAEERLTPRRVREAGIEVGVCPHELSLDLALHCDLIIADYNYVFDPRVMLRRFFAGPLQRRCVLLVDEAANLIERARGYYSPEIRERWLGSRLQLGGVLGEAGAAVFEPWRRLFASLREEVRDARVRELELPRDLELPLETGDRELLRAAGPPPWPRELRELWHAVRAFRFVGGLRDERFHLLLRRDRGELVLQWFCTDPAEFLAARWKGCRCAVAFSATLKPFEYFQTLLGFDPETTATLEVPYPFQQGNLGVWLEPRIETRYAARRATLSRLCRRILTIHARLPGTYFLFFPSYEYLSLVAERLEAAGMPVLAQRPGMRPAERRRFLQQLAAADHLVLTVAGGIFAEGVDLRAPNLRGALVIGPNLPAFDLPHRLLQQRFEDLYQQGFLYAFVIPGMHRVIQAAGRLIRGPEDRGVLILVGRRLRHPPYADLYPDHWLTDGAIPFLSEDAGELARFWSGEAL
jgi:DNA excision repair protein ERCC-2